MFVMGSCSILFNTEYFCHKQFVEINWEARLGFAEKMVHKKNKISDTIWRINQGEDRHIIGSADRHEDSPGKNIRKANHILYLLG